MKDVYWFKHDSNARNDIKIQALRHEYNVAGYGMFFMIIEIMRESDNNKLPYNKKFSNVGIARDLGVDVDLLISFIDSCINDYELFQCDGEYFWSESLNNRLYEHEMKKEKRKLDGAKGGRPSKQKEVEVVEKVEEPKQFEQIEKKEVVYDVEVVNLTDLFCNKLRENNEKAKIPSDLKKWNSAIDALNRLDGYSFEQIEKVILYSQENHFWKSNILSADKLRKQFSTLLMQSQNVKTFEKRNQTESITDTYNRLLKYVKGDDEIDERRNIEAIDIDSSVI